MTDCKHRNLQTWHFADDDTPAGMWSCMDCGHKFVPLDLEQEKDAARYRWLRDRKPGGTYRIAGMIYSDENAAFDAAIDAAMAAEVNT